MQVIFFNGPPRSGKDFAGKMLAEMLGEGVVQLKFAEPLKLATHAALAMLQNLSGIPAPAAFEATKDEPMEEFMGVSPRQAYIALSENFCKPLWGPGVFGELLAKRVQSLPEDTRYVIVTDCGFQEEVDVFQELVDADVLVAQVHRDGCDFSNDSRGWVNIPGATEIVFNKGTKEDLRLQLVYLMTDLMEQETLEAEMANDGC